MKAAVAVLFLSVMAHGCGGEEGVSQDDHDPHQGEILVLAYNVAGLPEWLSGSRPSVNTPQISPMLNAYDLVLVQEDFWYHSELVAQIDHAYQSTPMSEQPGSGIGDGLNRFSVLPLGDLTRLTWVACNGWLNCDFDCWATKGFSVSEVELGQGLVVDVYNLHMDAGGCDGDIDARGVQTEQLLEEIQARSGDKAVIVAGDTNLKRSRPKDMVFLDRLLSGADLEEACLVLDCAHEIHDRIMYRGSDSVSLVPLTWEHPGEFVDNEGGDLSDHKPVAVRFHWEGLR